MTNEHGYDIVEPMLRKLFTIFVVFLFSMFYSGNAPAATGVSSGELGFEEIIFVKRKPYSSNHYYTDINNGTSKDRFIPENGIYIYNLDTQKQRAVITVADMPGGNGFIGKITLSVDAKKVVFDFRENAGAGFRVWEVNAEGTGLRQISFVPEDEAEKVKRWGKKWHTDDIHPAYLPDGKIIFSSTRCEQRSFAVGLRNWWHLCCIVWTVMVRMSSSYLKALSANFARLFLTMEGLCITGGSILIKVRGLAKLSGR